MTVNSYTWVVIDIVMCSIYYNIQDSHALYMQKIFAHKHLVFTS